MLPLTLYLRAAAALFLIAVGCAIGWKAGRIGLNAARKDAAEAHAKLEDASARLEVINASLKQTEAAWLKQQGEAAQALAAQQKVAMDLRKRAHRLPVTGGCDQTADAARTLAAELAQQWRQP